MKLTPMEISGKKFRKRFRGVDAEEVSEFLEMISTELEEHGFRGLLIKAVEKAAKRSRELAGESKSGGSGGGRKK